MFLDSLSKPENEKYNGYTCVDILSSRVKTIEIIYKLGDYSHVDDVFELIERDKLNGSSFSNGVLLLPYIYKYRTDFKEQAKQEMLSAVNISAWDTVKYVKWSFRGGHDYVWDRTVNDARISWEDMEVHLDMDQVDGKAFKNGIALEGSEKDKAIQSAWSYWCNDSFWLTAPFKVFDKGTTRKMATDKDGKEGLLVTYESGGVTPGDQYL